MEYCTCVTYIHCGEVQEHGCISPEVRDVICDPLRKFGFCGDLPRWKNFYISLFVMNRCVIIVKELLFYIYHA